MKNKLKEKLKYFDYGLFIPYLILCLIGIVMVYSASAINLTYVGVKATSYLFKQIIFVGIGITLTLIFSHMNPKFWVSKNVLRFGYWTVIILLMIAKFLFGAINGANGWITLGSFSIQPAEIAKLYLVVAISKAFSKREADIYLGKHKRTTTRKNLAVNILPILALIAIEPDTGGATICAAICLVLILANSKNWRASIGILGVAISMIALTVMVIHAINPFKGSKVEYMYKRFEGYFDPFTYATTSGKQLVNSFYAISNGGLFGVGLGNSIQKRGYLPEPYTDFILAIIAEELGFIGVLVVLGLLFFIILRIILIGIRSNNTFNTLVCYGVATFFTVESIFNIGAVNGLLPITGVTLPFISYGGSSMVVLSMALGMVMNISANEKRHTARNMFLNMELKK
ncbi:FtsW/RodA/SpoVE family cell cycle protein [Ligilactobacillus salivarius]|uniref:FtsW/RodA/SpoVE family cell cycle protein n=1 Tax=Ligilactobacillus salivarius TaxID=1624 RepID=UPI0025A36EFC|nr:FtsW/RodA/SpoVE family cell cycle protein [Ligilactobacillus salivarius]MDM8272222.1 FtsW/RodA/SpoVE family cell cycle protein [Ligilactobacillus salivarius]